MAHPANHFPFLDKIELELNSTETSLQVVGEHCPNITELKLKASYVQSLRDIGTSFKNLRILKALKVGLDDLEGITSFPQITELYLAFNPISVLSALIYCDTLEILDLEGCTVNKMSELHHLDTCERLASVNLEGNPVSQEANYRE